VGSSIRVADITLPPGVETDVDPEALVVVGQPPQAAAEAAAMDAEVEAVAAGQAEASAESAEATQAQDSGAAGSDSGSADSGGSDEA